MSLVTRCPRCKTLFRVMPAQLQARSGQVKCGRCMHVFDGFQALAVEEPNAVIEPVRFEPTSASAAGGGAPASASPEWASAAGTGTETGAAPTGGAPTEPPAVPVTAPTAGASAAADAPVEAAKPFSVRLRAHFHEVAASRIDPLKQKYLRKPSPAAMRIAACVLLGVLLAVQATFAFRSQLAARYPVMRTVLTGVCDLAGCSVPLPQRPDLVTIEASDVHMIDVSRPALIQLTATLRSYANYDLAYPALDLVLTNANDHALARRIFVPEEYLDQTRSPQAGIPPRAEITVALDLDTGDLNAAGFRLALLPAPAP